MFNPDFAVDRWYVNLQAPPIPWTDGDLAGIDTFDHALDIVVAPDRQWRWKDENEYWTVERAEHIRAEGERVIQDIDAAAFPFDGTWCDFRPDRPGPCVRCHAPAEAGAEPPATTDRKRRTLDRKGRPGQLTGERRRQPTPADRSSHSRRGLSLTVALTC
jgi:hypothetical protein